MSKEILNLAQAEIRSCYSRLGINGSNILDLIDAALTEPQTLSPTGDRDCEELKKEVERLKKICEYIERNATKINEHTWKAYKEQILGHCEDAKPNL